ncbi:MAG: hypothetical protein LUB59_00390 [Candidatus Gastranaerophilales bacterium]|nr:hypothetical protein [Candidatus Gastranaerophilales bacterium]
MTNETDYSPITYNGNGATTEFKFDWKIFANSELIVKLIDSDENEETLTLNSDYTVTFNSTGGSVTFTSAPASDKIVFIARSVPNYQSTGYSTSVGFQGSEIEKSFDKVSCNLQEMDYNIEEFKTEINTTLSDVISAANDIETALATVSDASEQAATTLQEAEELAASIEAGKEEVSTVCETFKAAYASTIQCSDFTEFRVYGTEPGIYKSTADSVNIYYYGSSNTDYYITVEHPIITASCSSSCYTAQIEDGQGNTYYCYSNSSYGGYNMINQLGVMSLLESYKISSPATSSRYTIQLSTAQQAMMSASGCSMFVDITGCYDAGTNGTWFYKPMYLNYIGSTGETAAGFAVYYDASNGVLYIHTNNSCDITEGYTCTASTTTVSNYKSIGIGSCGYLWVHVYMVKCDGTFVANGSITAL